MQLYSHDIILFLSLQIIDNKFFSILFYCFWRAFSHSFYRRILIPKYLSSTRHHLRAYIVFLIVSLLLVGILAYLYTPFNIDTSKLGSQTILSAEVQMSAEVIVREETDTSSTATKRIRLTNLLLRYQKELSDLESA